MTAVFGAAALVHDSPVRSPARLDVPGLLLGSVGLAALVYGFGRAEPRGWTDLLVVVLLVGGLVLLLVFAWWQTRTTDPLLPPYVFRDRNRVGSCLALAFIGMGMLVQYLVLTRYLQGALGYTPSQTGVALLPMAGAVVIASTQVSARLYLRLAPRGLIVPGLVLAATGLALLTGLDADSVYATRVLPGTLLIGFGLGLAFVPLFATATGGIAPRTPAGPRRWSTWLNSQVVGLPRLCSAVSSPRRSPPGWIPCQDLLRVWPKQPNMASCSADRAFRRDCPASSRRPTERS